jgi:hypothetical protein
LCDKLSAIWQIRFTIVAGNRILDHHNAICAILDVVKQVTIINIVVRIAAFQAIAFANAHLHGKTISVDFPWIFITSGFRIDNEVIARPQNAAHFFDDVMTTLNMQIFSASSMPLIYQ